MLPELLPLRVGNNNISSSSSHYLCLHPIVMQILRELFKTLQKRKKQIFLLCVSIYWFQRINKATQSVTSSYVGAVGCNEEKVEIENKHRQHISEKWRVL